MVRTRSNRARALAAALVVGGAGLGGALLGAAPASAQAASEANGCSNSPDSGYAPYRFDFLDACNQHDQCYGSQPYGGGAAGRAACDADFLADMQSWCADHHGGGAGQRNCENLAGTYYRAVRTFGGSHFPDLPTPIVTVGPLEPVPPTPTVTVGPVEQVDEGTPPPPRGGGGGGGGGGSTSSGGGGGSIGGSSGGSSGGTPTVTVGEPETVAE